MSSENSSNFADVGKRPGIVTYIEVRVSLMGCLTHSYRYTSRDQFSTLETKYTCSPPVDLARALMLLLLFLQPEPALLAMKTARPLRAARR